jgi:hypothetical protein
VLGLVEVGGCTVVVVAAFVVIVVVVAVCGGLCCCLLLLVGPSGDVVVVGSVAAVVIISPSNPFVSQHFQNFISPHRLLLWWLMVLLLVGHSGDGCCRWCCRQRLPKQPFKSCISCTGLGVCCGSCELLTPNNPSNPNSPRQSFQAS